MLMYTKGENNANAEKWLTNATQYTRNTMKFYNDNHMMRLHRDMVRMRNEQELWEIRIQNQLTTHLNCDVECR